MFNWCYKQNKLNYHKVWIQPHFYCKPGQFWSRNQNCFAKIWNIQSRWSKLSKTRSLLPLSPSPSMVQYVWYRQSWNILEAQLLFAFCKSATVPELFKTKLPKKNTSYSRTELALKRPYNYDYNYIMSRRAATPSSGCGQIQNQPTHTKKKHGPWSSGSLWFWKCELLH